MKTLVPLTLLLLGLSAAAQAECYADYKAKRDDPLRLHYGVAQLAGPCELDAALTELAPRLAADDWQLLSVESVFDASELEEKQDSAGEFYLRY